MNPYGGAPFGGFPSFGGFPYGYGAFPPYAGLGPAYPFVGPGAPYLEVDMVLDDEDIEENVRDSIDLDPYITRGDKNSIVVDVSGGVAKLSGTVRNRRSIPLAFTDAFWAAGVIDVESTLKLEEMPRKPAEQAAQQAA